MERRLLGRVEICLNEFSNISKYYLKLLSTFYVRNWQMPFCLAGISPTNTVKKALNDQSKSIAVVGMAQARLGVERCGKLGLEMDELGSNLLSTCEGVLGTSF